MFVEILWKFVVEILWKHLVEIPYGKLSSKSYRNISSRSHGKVSSIFVSKKSSILILCASPCFGEPPLGNPFRGVCHLIISVTKYGMLIGKEAQHQPSTYVKSTNGGFLSGSRPAVKTPPDFKATPRDIIQKVKVCTCYDTSYE